MEYPVARIDAWCHKMRLTRQQAADLLFIDIERIEKERELRQTSPQLQALMNYYEIMLQPNIDKAATVMRKHYRKIKADHWE